MFTIPDPDPKKPLKNNILYLFSAGYILDVDSIYQNISGKRDIPSGKDKYRGIERAIKQLEKEEWPIHKESDKNGIIWYRAGTGFNAFLIEKTLDLCREINGTMDYAKRFDVQIKEAQKNHSSISFSSFPVSSDNIPLKLVPKYLKPKKK